MQMELFNANDADKVRQQINCAMDSINERYG